MPSPADAAPSYVWAAAIPEAGSSLTLDEQESRYLTKICRARAGERVTLTDGRGRRAQATLIQPGEAVVLEIVETQQVALERIATLLVGAPERGRADWMVEKLAELGVGFFQPIDTERSEWASSELRPDRWERLARAALRQSLRCHEMEVRELLPLPAAIDRALPQGPAKRYLADPGGTPAGRLSPQGTGHTVCVVGPAAGFSTGERGQLTSAGFIPISLSDARLRTETAALALAAWWSGAA